MRQRRAHHRMEADMAPPHKRRRLTGSSPRPSPSLTLSEPSPTLSHTVEQLEHRPSLALLPRPVPQHIEEVHLQIQKKAVVDVHEHHRQVLQRRQGTAVSSALDSTLTVTVLQWADVTGGIAFSTINDDLGGTYGTTSTLLLVSSPIPSATTTPSSTDASSTESSQGSPSSSPSDGFIGNSPSGTGVSSTEASSGTGAVTSTAPSSAGVTAASISGSSATNSTRTDTTRSSDASASSDSSRASLGAGVFLYTLSNGDVISVARSDEAYATTFADGRVSTIAPSSSRTSDDDDSSSRTTTRASDDSSSTQSSQQSTATSVNYITGPNQTQQSPATPTQNSLSSTSSGAGGGGGGGPPAPPGTIAGGVVGGAAGLAVIILVALVLLRWWKRKAQNGHHALPPSSDFTPDPDASSSMRGQPGMAERAGLRPLVGAVPAFFRHSNRSSEPSTVPSGERGFTRVSGRKLPSQFSAGMSSSEPYPGPAPQMAASMPLAGPGARSPDVEHERNLSSTSFYRDSDGFYGGEGAPVASASPSAAGAGAGIAMGFTGHSPSPSESLEDPPAGRGPTPEEMTLSPGPRRTPTVHRGGPYTMTPSSTVPSTPAMPLSPAAPSSGVGSPTVPAFSGDGRGGYGVIGGGGAEGGGAYARSETPTSSTVPDNRSSRFTEEV